MVVHFICLCLTGFYGYLSTPGKNLFSWHPSCMVIAFGLLVLQAILVFSPISSLTSRSPRSDKVQLHWIFQCFAMLAAAAGFGSVYLNKELNSRSHFQTWHGKFGLATLIGMLLAFTAGVAANYSINLRNYIRPFKMRMYHATSGMLVFLLASTTMTLATYSNWLNNRVQNPWVWRALAIAPVILGVCIARQVTQSYLPKILKPRDSEIDAKNKRIEDKIKAKIETKEE